MRKMIEAYLLLFFHVYDYVYVIVLTIRT